MNNKQTGSALIISLLILLVMTMVGINSMSSSALEEKMASNDRNQKIIFQHAETNLKAAETNIASQRWSSELYTALAENDAGYFTENDAPVDYFNNNAWQAGATCINLPNNQNNSTSCYVLEVLEGPYQGTSFSLYPRQYGELPPDPGNLISKITLRNTDGNGMGKTILQSTHKKLAMD